MKLKKWELALIAALVLTFVFGAGLTRQQQNLSDKLIRLHVIAHSDSDADQALKLKVRDAVLDTASELLDGITDRDEAGEMLSEQINKLTAAGKAVVSDEGYDYAVTAEIGLEEYPTRDYDTFSLPAGTYTSLRIVIGEGGGHNWWCVIFPPMCLGTALDESDLAAGLTTDEIRLITSDGPEYEIKFKTLEILEFFREFFGFGRK